MSHSICLEVGTTLKDLTSDFIIKIKAKPLFLSSSKHAAFGQSSLRSQYWKIHTVFFICKMLILFTSHLKYLCIFFPLSLCSEVVSNSKYSDLKKHFGKYVQECYFNQ